MPNLTFISSTTHNTVRPTETKFTNNTDKDVVLNSIGASVSVEKGQTSAGLNATIISIHYNAMPYFVAEDSYTIREGQNATLNKSGDGLTLEIS